MSHARPLPDLSHWYVIRAHYRQEARAAANLTAGGIETFLPWVRVVSRRRQQRRDREPLFPQYLFARFDPDASLHDVTFTRGVQSLLRVGDQPATVDDSVIDFFRSRRGADGLIPLGRTPRPGDSVTIQSGPFAELIGVVERNLPARERVVVLLTTARAPIRVEVRTDDLRASEVRLAI